MGGKAELHREALGGVLEGTFAVAPAEDQELIRLVAQSLRDDIGEIADSFPTLYILRELMLTLEDYLGTFESQQVNALVSHLMLAFFTAYGLDTEGGRYASSTTG